jgi:hypothetical protein
MSLKRSLGGINRTSGGSDAGAKVDRQDLYDQLKKLAASNASFTPVDVALATGAGEPQVSRAMLGLAAEGCVEKVEGGKYRVSSSFTDLSMAEFIKLFNRASKTDSTRQRDLMDIARLKQNNDVMRAKLLQAIAERDHYLAALQKHGIDAGPPPVLAPPATAAATEAPPAVAPAAEAPPATGSDDPPTGLA